MKLDLSNLKHVQHKPDGKTTAQCPACAADGGDAKGEHLVIFRDGKFGCVASPKDKAHNRKILELVGIGDRGDGGSGCRLTVKPLVVEESKVLMKVGRLGRVKPSPEQPDKAPPPPDHPHPDCPRVGETHPERPGPMDASTVAAKDVSPEITEVTLRDFLDLPALAA